MSQTALEKHEQRLLGRLVMTRVIADPQKFKGVDSRHILGRRETIATLLKLDDNAVVWVRNLLAPEWAPHLVFLQTEVHLLRPEHLFGPRAVREYELLDHQGVGQSPTIPLQESITEPDPDERLGISIASYPTDRTCRHKALKALLETQNLGALVFRAPDLPHPDEPWNTCA